MRQSLLILLVLHAFVVCLSGCSDEPGGLDEDAGVTDTVTETETDTNTDTDTYTTTDTDSISGMSLEVHPKVATILVLTWTQERDVDSVWVEFTFENDMWFASHKKVGAQGAHKEVILGVPEETEVTVRVVNEQSGSTWNSDPIKGTTGSIPAGMPRPAVTDEYNSATASAQKWLMGSVENSSSEEAYWESPYWIFIMDRKARIVWYYHNPLDSRILFPRISPDGTHILYDEHPSGLSGSSFGIRRRTLDLEYSEDLSIPEIYWGYDIADDDYIIYYDYKEGYGGGGGGGGNASGALMERSPSGDVREIWSCNDWVDSIGVDPYCCYSNTVSWSKERNSVILSFNWELCTVLEIDRETGAIMSQWGNLSGSWDFNPSNIQFNMQHYPNITKDGTLLVSFHGSDWSSTQDIMDFEVDDENKTLNQIWSYGEGVEEYAAQGGEATRVDNGNTLISYGTGGVIKEVTPDKQTAWSVIFDASFSSSTNNKLLTHLTLIDDLYALNQGPAE